MTRRDAAAMLELGALAGALLAGTFADRYSRKISIFSACGKTVSCLENILFAQFCSVVFCVGSLLQCSAQSLGHLIWGRTIGGIGDRILKVNLKIISSWQSMTIEI